MILTCEFRCIAVTRSGLLDSDTFPFSSLGCEDCIDCRMTCTAPLERRQLHDEEKTDATATLTNSNAQGTSEEISASGTASASNSSAEEPGLKGSNPPLPKDLEVWFDAWGVRRSTWYNKWTTWDRRNRRKGACDRHDYCDLVSITGDLLEGEFNL